MDFYQWLVDNVVIHDNPNYQTMAPERKVIEVSYQLLGALRKGYDSLATPSKLDDAEIVAAVTKFYDKYLVPIDLPMNDMVERIIESQVRGFIAAGVEAVAIQVRSRNS